MAGETTFGHGPVPGRRIEVEMRRLLFLLAMMAQGDRTEGRIVQTFTLSKESMTAFNVSAFATSLADNAGVNVSFSDVELTIEMRTTLILNANIESGSIAIPVTDVNGTEMLYYNVDELKSMLAPVYGVDVGKLVIYMSGGSVVLDITISMPTVNEDMYDGVRLMRWLDAASSVNATTLSDLLGVDTIISAPPATAVVSTINCEFCDITLTAANLNNATATPDLASNALWGTVEAVTPASTSGGTPYISGDGGAAKWLRFQYLGVIGCLAMFTAVSCLCCAFCTPQGRAAMVRSARWRQKAKAGDGKPRRFEFPCKHCQHKIRFTAKPPTSKKEWVIGTTCASCKRLVTIKVDEAKPLLAPPRARGRLSGRIIKPKMSTSADDTKPRRYECPCVHCQYVLRFTPKPHSTVVGTTCPSCKRDMIIKVDKATPLLEATEAKPRRYEHPCVNCEYKLRFTAKASSTVIGTKCPSCKHDQRIKVDEATPIAPRELEADATLHTSFGFAPSFGSSSQLPSEAVEQTEASRNPKHLWEISQQEIPANVQTQASRTRGDMLKTIQQAAEQSTSSDVRDTQHGWLEKQMDAIERGDAE